MGPIANAANRPLNQNSGTVPDVGDALLDWFQPMVFTTLVKSVDGFQNVETPTDVNFMGVWQPMSMRRLAMKPEGQRSWKWFTVHAQPSLVLEPDEIVTYLGEQYRVMAHKDYKLYGYVEYELVNDFTGSGPA